MSDMLLSPPAALLSYALLAALLWRAAGALAGPGDPSAMKQSTYASGEAPPKHMAAPGYRPYFVTALFFAVVHLGALVIATGGLTAMMGAYVAGLILTLLVLALR